MAHMGTCGVSWCAFGARTTSLEPGVLLGGTWKGFDMSEDMMLQTLWRIIVHHSWRNIRCSVYYDVCSGTWPGDCKYILWLFTDPLCWSLDCFYRTCNARVELLKTVSFMVACGFVFNSQKIFHRILTGSRAQSVKLLQRLCFWAAKRFWWSVAILHHWLIRLCSLHISHQWYGYLFLPIHIRLY